MDKIQTLKTAEDAPANPFALFDEWFFDACTSEPNDPNAMALATVDPDGRPSCRIVLLKAHDERGFVFYTNMESRKGQALKAHPFAALNFHWKTLGRAVRIEGTTAAVSAEESDAYYATRSPGSRIGAWASRQSRPLGSSAELEQRIAEMEAKHPDGDIPRPAYWHGTRVAPQRIEFWHDGADRLHTRLVYIRTDKGWEKQMLYP